MPMVMSLSKIQVLQSHILIRLGSLEASVEGSNISCMIYVKYERLKVCSGT